MIHILSPIEFKTKSSIFLKWINITSEQKLPVFIELLQNT